MKNYLRRVAFVRCLFLHVTDGISCKLVGLLLHISMNNPSGRCIVMFKDLPGTHLPQLLLVYELQGTRVLYEVQVTPMLQILIRCIRN
jgi:hypothetical protein